MKKLIILLMVVLVTFQAGVALAAGLQYTDKAEQLKQLNLFRGTEQGDELDKVFTRAQGAVMLYRILGLDRTEMPKNLKSPFSDTGSNHWSYKYVTYLSQKGLIKGTGKNNFSPETQMSGEEFITLTLRALGYAEAEPKTAFKLALDKGLLNAAEIKDIQSKKTFLRDDMVLVAHNALKTSMKGGYLTLIDKLVTVDLVVSMEAAEKCGFYGNVVKPEEPKLEPKVEPVTPIDGMDLIEQAIKQALRK